MTLKEIKLKYTRVDKVDGKWVAFLQIDNQRFRVCDGTTKAMAKCYQKMLSKAIEDLIEMTTKMIKSDYPEWKETYK